MYHNFFIHSSVSGNLGCFPVLAVVNSAAVNIEVHVSFSILVSLGYMPRSGIAGSYREGDGTPLQYSCLENPTDGGAWKAAVHGVLKNWTRLRDFTFPFHFHTLEKWRPTPVLLPGESQGWGNLVGCRLWGCSESDMTEAT